MRSAVSVAFLGLTAFCAAAANPDPAKRFVHADGNKLAYETDARGNRIPDFSHAGYAGGGVPIPDVTVRVTVPAAAGDATPRLQAAIDYVSGLSPDANGFRGAVLIAAGRHEIAGQLRVTASGVVLRGQGNGTVLAATGTGRRTLIDVRGKPNPTAGTPVAIADDYVPVGATKFRLESAKGLKAGDNLFVDHPSTKEWIAAVEMDKFPSKDGRGSYLDWKPGRMDLRWDRTITGIDGDTVTLDAPITSALDAALTKCQVRPYTWADRIHHVGVENLRCESTFDPKNPLDEQHAWNAIGFECAEDVWVRQVTFAHFAGSAVAIWETCRRATVEDCVSEKPVSEIGGYRRHTFYTSGGQTLFLRCKANEGRHDFAVGFFAPGPNAFVECEAVNAHNFSGPIESWASGVLYDNVNIDGGGLLLTNRETEHQGTGWAAANSVLWQCVAPMMACRMPPTAQNWSIGCWSQFVGNGHWRSYNEFVKPDVLYDAQLGERLGGNTLAATKRRAISTDAGGAKTVDELAPERVRKLAQPEPRPTHPLSLKNGWLVTDGKPMTGSRTGNVWWRGQVNPHTAASFGTGITRYVPGRTGPGFTDNLDELTDEMRSKGQAVYDHHYGLWYDRRRDDHEMFRRMDGEVWPPFYEHPWARSGQGKGWDGLSKYDLTTFNPFFYDRLKEFADRAAEKGLVLVQQMYFQHNILEAGAHWAEFPWRSANCLQPTGFPEPPPYEGKKRVFMADEFYDVKHPVRRELHRTYIRHTLDELADRPNVIFQTSEEFTGPLHFVQYWIDTIGEWEKEKGKKVLVGLSCTKDVQDAILADPVRAAVVSVIDLKYWWYTPDGGVYDPKGGQNLAPRQFLRTWKGLKNRSDESTARAVREYRSKFPDKAVVCSFDNQNPNGWAVVTAGGSIPVLPKTTDARLLAALPGLKPFESDALGDRQWAVAAPGQDYLVYSAAGRPVRLDLPGGDTFAAYQIDPRTGQAKLDRDGVRGRTEFRPGGAGPAVLWVTRLRN